MSFLIAFDAARVPEGEHNLYLHTCKNGLYKKNVMLNKAKNTATPSVTLVKIKVLLLY